MRLQLSFAFSFFISFLLPIFKLAAQGHLTDVVIFSADSAGNWSAPDIWHTRPNGNFEVFIQNSAGVFVNGPTSTNVQPNFLLPGGNNALRLFANPGVDSPLIGINLFFDGATTPSISAFAALLTSGQQPHNFAADGALHTPKPFPGINTGYNFPGAGTLSFVDGNQIISLTDFYLANPSVFSLDKVGNFSVGADGLNDYVGGITLAVSPIPEPNLGFWGLGLLLVFARLKRRAVDV
jgi:hypothetical protein